jgi:hypothetical protein
MSVTNLKPEAVSTDLYRGHGVPGPAHPEWLGWLAIFSRVSSPNCVDSAWVTSIGELPAMCDRAAP